MIYSLGRIEVVTGLVKSNLTVFPSDFDVISSSEAYDQDTLPTEDGKGLKILQALRKAISPQVFCTREQNSEEWEIYGNEKGAIETAP